MYRKHTQPDGYAFYQQDLYFIAKAYQGTIENKEPRKADEVAFFPIDGLPSNVSPFIQHALECILKGEIYSEFGHRKL